MNQLDDSCTKLLQPMDVRTHPGLSVEVVGSKAEIMALGAGQPPPRGEGLVGWRIAVYWKEEKQFYQGTVEDYDAELDQHTISYNDGILLYH